LAGGFIKGRERERDDKLLQNTNRSNFFCFSLLVGNLSIPPTRILVGGGGGRRGSPASNYGRCRVQVGDDEEEIDEEEEEVVKY